MDFSFVKAARRHKVDLLPHFFPKHLWAPTICFWILEIKRWRRSSLWSQGAHCQETVKKLISSVSSVAQSCLTLCDPMDCSTPGFPVHQQLPELTQTHVYQVSDAIQPSHPLSAPSPLAFNLSSIRVFSSESVFHIRWSKYWSFSFSISPSKEYSGLISFRIDWLDLFAVQVTLKSLLQHHSSTASWPR